MQIPAGSVDDAAPLQRLVDRERYPIFDLKGERGQRLIDECRRQLAKHGCVVLKHIGEVGAADGAKLEGEVLIIASGMLARYPSDEALLGRSF